MHNRIASHDDPLRPDMQRGMQLGFIRLLRGCWAADPADRPTMGEVLESLDSLAYTLMSCAVN